MPVIVVACIMITIVANAIIIVSIIVITRLIFPIMPLTPESMIRYPDHKVQKRTNS